MSAKITSLIWTKSKAQGTQRLVLLALADSANMKGLVELSLRDIAEACRLSKTRVSEIISKLIDLGELQNVSSGGGAARYRVIVAREVDDWPVREIDKWREDKIAIEEEMISSMPGADVVQDVHPERETDEMSALIETEMPLRIPTPAPEITQNDVNTILAAAKVTAPEDSPFYWARREHRTDLAALLTRRGVEVTTLRDQLQIAIADGRMLKDPPKRISDLEELLRVRNA